MILRRFSESLKEQNWTAIVIEFVLLVVGVFLGIQAQQWANARAEHRQERVYLERILADIRISIETDQLNAARLTASSDGIISAVERSEDVSRSAPAKSISAALTASQGLSSS